jgi:hypothetical protein
MRKWPRAELDIIAEAALREIDDIERYCELSDLSTSIDREAANVRDIMLHIDIPFARKEIRSGADPRKLLRDLQSSALWLLGRLAPYTRDGLRLKKLHLEEEDHKDRDKWIVEEVCKKSSNRVGITEASKRVRKDLLKTPWPAVSDRQIRTIYWKALKKCDQHSTLFRVLSPWLPSIPRPGQGSGVGCLDHDRERGGGVPCPLKISNK